MTKLCNCGSCEDAMNKAAKIVCEHIIPIFKDTCPIMASGVAVGVRELTHLLLINSMFNLHKVDSDDISAVVAVSFEAEDAYKVINRHVQGEMISGTGPKEGRVVLECMVAEIGDPIHSFVSKAMAEATPKRKGH